MKTKKQATEKKHTIVSFNINFKNEMFLFQNILKSIIKKQDADIVLLQEIYIANAECENKVIKSLTDKLEGTWGWYTTVDDTITTTQNNAVLFNKNNFKSIKYLNKEQYNTTCKETNNMCKSTHNNVQALEFDTGKEKIIVVNSHISPHGSYHPTNNITSYKYEHTKDYLNLMQFVNRLDNEKNIPIVLAGDMNFGTKDLRKLNKERKFDNKWIVDGDENEVPSDYPWVTALKGVNPWDHFFFNNNFHDRMLKVYVKEFDGYYGMRHAIDNNEIQGVMISYNKNNAKYMSFDWYMKNVSDHLPICLTIKTK